MRLPVIGARFSPLRRFSKATAVWILVAVLLAWATWTAWPALATLLRDERALQAFVLRLGWWGPPALIVLSVIQIILAPVPGYAVYVAGGFLYGALWGGLFGALGVLLGGGLAMVLARCFGRPLVIRMVGARTLARWETVVRSDSLLLWGLLLLSPIGDSPFYLAGLSRVRLGHTLLLACAIRAPQAFAVAAVGSGAFDPAWWQLGVFMAVTALPILVYIRYRNHLAPMPALSSANLATNDRQAGDPV